MKIVQNSTCSSSSMTGRKYIHVHLPARHGQNTELQPRVLEPRVLEKKRDERERQKLRVEHTIHVFFALKGAGTLEVAGSEERCLQFATGTSLVLDLFLIEIHNNYIKFAGGFHQNLL